MLRSRQNGFTLIELLVVLVIIGVLVSFAVLSLGDGGKRDRLMEEGKRVAALIELAGDQAVLEGREWGIHVAPDGYLFMVLTQGTWQEAAGDQMFRARQLEQGFSLELRVEDLAVSLIPPNEDTQEKETLDQKKVEPQVFLMSSAERTPFELVITAPGGEPVVVVEVPMIGEVQLRVQTPL